MEYRGLFKYYAHMAEHVSDMGLLAASRLFFFSYHLFKKIGLAAATGARPSALSFIGAVFGGHLPSQPTAEKCGVSGFSG